jgi:hypothetical protein
MSHLTEPGVKYHFLEIFKENKQLRIDYHTQLFNAGLLLLFIGGIGCFLYFKKKTKMTPIAKNKKLEEDRMYILNKIKSLDIHKPTNYIFT